MGLFVRLTVLIAIAILALMVLAFVIKAIVIGAILAALAVAAVLGINFVRRLNSNQAGPLVRR
jgi:hypothetical protein